MDGPVSWYGRVYPKDVIIHQDYDDSNLKNDIAMMKLVDAPEDLYFDPSVAPISLPFEYYDLVNQTGTVVSILSSYLLTFYLKIFIFADRIWTGIRHFCKHIRSFEIQYIKRYHQ